MSVFRGDDKINIFNCLHEFEEMAEPCNWTDIQKIIYAKRLLRGSAEKFVNYG
ncbi:unnamed protein product, partial [Heterotrigona itama]